MKNCCIKLKNKIQMIRIFIFSLESPNLSSNFINNNMKIKPK